jgi:hypothetical protein
MKTRVILIALSLFMINVSLYAQNCFVCTGNTGGTKSSAFGDGNAATGSRSVVMGESCSTTGIDSFVGGLSSTSSGNYSFVFGQSNSVLASNSFVLGKFSQIGLLGSTSFSIGEKNNIQTSSSITIGRFITTSVNNSIIIGSGEDEPNRLSCSVANSLAIGFRSTVPTLFVGPSVPPNGTGNVGIATTNPLSKLDVNGDMMISGGSRKLELSGGNGRILLSGGEGNILFSGGNGTIKTLEASRSLKFYTGDLNLQMVIDGLSGKIGIGTSSPQEKLDINGNLLLSGGQRMVKLTGGNGAIVFSQGSGTIGTDDSRNPLNFYTGTENLRMKINGDNGNIGIATDDPKTKLEVQGSVSVGYSTVLLDTDRSLIVRDNVGIGTSSPSEKLDVAGTVRMTGLKIPTNANIGYVLTSNSTGDAFWIDPTLGYYWQRNLNNDIYRMTKVGIKTQNPLYDLDVAGSLGIKDDIKGYSTGNLFDALRIYGSAETDAPLIEIGRAGITVKKGIKLICPDPTGDIQMHINSAVAVVFEPHLARFGYDGYEMGMNVNGKINATEVQVKLDAWQDEVFDVDYALMDLNDLETYISANRHLPEVPAESEVISNGINVGEMNALLMKKIEELTLYVIDLKKENEEIKTRLENLIKVTEK